MKRGNTLVSEQIYFPEGDGAHVGVTDLYPEWEKKMREHWDEGRPKFLWDSKKGQVRISKRNDRVDIEIDVYTDEGSDLIDDALSDEIKNCRYSHATLVDTIMDYIHDQAWQVTLAGEWPNRDECPADATLEEVLEKVEELYHETQKSSNDNFEDLKVLCKKYGDVWLKVANSALEELPLLMVGLPDTSPAKKLAVKRLKEE